MIASYIALARPSHYLKNLLVLAPIFFAQDFFDLTKLFQALVVLAAFSLCASAVYVFNDYCDAENDKQHPQKKYRPISLGLISSRKALAFMAVLLIVSFLLSSLINTYVSAVLALYFVLNVFYSLGLKAVPGVDVILIAIGFCLRLVAGAVVTQTPLSLWIIALCFSVTLFIALAKRKNELFLFQEQGLEVRRQISKYPSQLLNICIVLSALITLSLYIAYSFNAPSSPNALLILSSLFVALGLARYVHITFKHNVKAGNKYANNSGSPISLLLTDHYLQLIISAWLATFFWVLYSA